MKLILCEWILGIIVFFTGTCIFSFLNVIIYRVPRKMSFVREFSMCPACGHRLSTGDLIPVFSYVLLRGRCRYCKASIGSRDTWIELLGGIAALFCIIKYENIETALTVFAFFSLLTVVTFLDIDTMEIENGCWIAILILSVISLYTMRGITFIDRGIGFLCVSLPMLALALVIPGAFGGGDIKLMAACGVFLGWRLTLVSTVLAILGGDIYGIWLMAAKKAARKEKFAFGPFLCVGMVIGLVYGEQLLTWYMGYASG